MASGKTPAWGEEEQGLCRPVNKPLLFPLEQLGYRPPCLSWAWEHSLWVLLPLFLLPLTISGPAPCSQHWLSGGRHGLCGKVCGSRLLLLQSCDCHFTPGDTDLFPRKATRAPLPWCAQVWLWESFYLGTGSQSDCKDHNPPSNLLYEI